MTVSILHRVTGHALAFGAVVLFTWWLLALASGPDAYRAFRDVAMGPLGVIVGIGLTWSVFQHMASGIRHLVMDTGDALDIVTAKRTATATFFVSGLMTLLVWGYIVYGGGY